MSSGQILACLRVAALMLALAIIAPTPVIGNESAQDEPVPAAPSEDDRERVEHADEMGESAVRDLLAEAEATANYGIAAALLETSIITEDVSYEPGLPGWDPDLGFGSRCHGKVKSRTNFAHPVPFSDKVVIIGWREAIIRNWCWTGNHITRADEDYDSWAGALYCWRNVNQSDYWLHYPLRRAVRNKASLAWGNGSACVGGQSIAPSVHYEAGGRSNVYANDQ